MVATADIIDELRGLIEERSLLKHPFYRAWQAGELNLAQLRGYASQYYEHVLAFPQYVSAAHAICPDQGERQELLENLIEEERGDENHPELWLRFAEGVGATRESVIDAEPLAETARLVELFRDATSRRSFAEACQAGEFRQYGGRRLGAGHRQPLQSGGDRHRRHCFRQRTQYCPRQAIPVVHSDRRSHQSG